MSKADFLNGLKKSLSDSFSEEQVNNNVSFYIHYINEEIAKGRDEEEIVDELGDPRLIAKTIKTVNGNEVALDIDESENENEKNKKQKNTNNKTIYYTRSASIIGCFIVSLVLFIIIALIFRFLGFMLAGTLGLVFGFGPVSLLIILFIIYILMKK